jgi:hypothetical protein
LFLDGSIFFSGVYRNDAGKGLEGKTFSAIFDNSGRIRTELKATGSDYVASTHLPEYNAVRGDDNYVYFLRDDRIFVLSASGKTIRTIHFEKPDKEMQSTRLDLSQGLISIELSKLYPRKAPDGRKAADGIATSYLILDSNDDHVMDYYLPDDALGNNMACFSRRDGYTFISTDAGKFKLLEAELR